MKAVVMAGGEGSRLRPLTSRRPKPLAPVANKPVMHHIVDLLRRHGITEIVATLHYLADEIESYFGDGSEFGVQMSYVVEDTPLGTAGAVKLAQQLLREQTILIVSGDALTDLDLTAAIEDHRANASDATIVLQRVTNPLEFGVVVTDADGAITRFLEKPSWGEVFSDTINTGIYVLEPSVLDYMESGKIYDFSKDLFPRMLRDGRKLRGFITSDYWTDIGTLEQYQRANYDALLGRVVVELPGHEVAPGIRHGEGVRVDPSATLVAPVVLGKNVRIGAGVHIEGPTVLGSATIVERGAKLTRTVGWEDVFIGAEATLGDCTIAERNTIKERVTIGEGATIGRGCTIGRGAIVRPNMKLWPDKWVSSGATVSMSLIYGMKWPGSLFGGAGVTGLANFEITPEFTMKLGQAFGSHLRAGQTVTTSRDTHPLSRIMNRCIISGLLSVGINVQDLRAYPLPPARYATRTGGDGGVHVRISPDDPSGLVIEFFDAGGINVDKSVERKIENLFFREDFRRTPMDDVGRLDFPSRSLERYTAGFLEALKPTAMRTSRFRVAIDYAYGNTATVLPRILGGLGIEMIALNAYFDATMARASHSDRHRNLTQLGDIVQTLEMDLGMLIDSDGESLTLVDERGRIIDRTRLLALVTLLVARAVPGARIAMPVTAPGAIETIAGDNGATVVRARNDRRGLMAQAAAAGPSLSFVGGTNSEMIFPEFQPAFDALYGAAKIIEYLTTERRPLGELYDLLPTWHTTERLVSCPWERKGEVMRVLHDAARDEIDETIDGIRLRRDGGWVLVLPDASEPTVNVYAEGPSDEAAARYADELANRIGELTGAGRA